VTDDLQQVRVKVAEAHGLPARAASLLDGETVEELETQAGKLATLVGMHGGPGREEPTDVFSVGRREKERRCRELHDALTGRHGRQSRDDRGRFVGSGFDGGARSPVSADPPTGGDVLADALRTGSHDVGADFGSRRELTTG
jgi:hypothetical protein